MACYSLYTSQHDFCQAFYFLYICLHFCLALMYCCKCECVWKNERVNFWCSLFDVETLLNMNRIIVNVSKYNMPECKTQLNVKKWGFVLHSTE